MSKLLKICSHCMDGVSLVTCLRAEGISAKDHNRFVDRIKQAHALCDGKLSCACPHQVPEKAP